MYKHGNYAVFNMDEAHEASASKGNYAPVYVGALPVHTVAGGKCEQADSADGLCVGG